MDTVLTWYDTYDEMSSANNIDMGQFLNTCPDDVRQVFVECVWDTFEECERILRGPILCPRTGHMSDEYNHNIHVLRVIWNVSTVVNVPRHEDLVRNHEFLEHIVYDRKLEWYNWYESDVLCCAPENENDDMFGTIKPDFFYSKLDVDPEEWNDAYVAEYRRLWNTTHGNRYFPELTIRYRIARNQDRDGAAQARADFYERFPENVR